MATVYRALLRGPGGAARPIALKLIHPHLCQEEEFIRLFLAEMRVAMAMGHRNIVQTFDAGKEGIRYFMVMELINGPSLREVLKRHQGHLPVDIALFVTMELCAALDYAHTFQPELTGQPGAVVHRDVSPGNVLLSGAGDVKLTDFGVARAKDALMQSSSDLVMGKLCYMAPEQARGRAVPGSDLFSVGAVLYELLSGTFFRNASSLEDVLAGSTNLKPLSQIRDDVPISLDQLIQRVLHPTAEERPASAKSLRDALAEELFRMQVQDGQSDAHARLAAFLENLPQPSEHHDPLSAQIADALLAEARDIQTDVGMAPNSGPRLGPGGITAETKIGFLRESDTHLRVSGEGSREVSLSTTDTKERAPRWQLVLWGSVTLIGVLLLALFMMKGPSNHITSSGDAALQSRQDTAMVSGADMGRDLMARAQDLTRQGDQGAENIDTAADQRVSTKRPEGKTKRRRPRGKGFLNLNSFPWSKVYIRGTYRGDTPIEELELPAGQYKVLLVNPQRNLRKIVRIKIRAGKSLRKAVTFH